MLFEGNSEVLARLHEKKRLLAEGNPRHEEIRPALLVLSGTMRGVYGGGQVTALERFGLTSAFDIALGVSTGAPTAAYFVAGQAALGTTLYSEECTRPEFIRARRIFSGGWPVDTGYLARVFRGECSNKKLDQRAILASRTALYAGVTCAETGEGIFVDAKRTSPDVVEALKPSMSFPGLSPGPTHIGSRRCVDGVGGLPFPAPRVMSEFNPTDLLVFANCSEQRRSRKNLVELLLSPLLFRKCGKATKEAFARRNAEALDDLIKTRQQKQCRVAVVWTDDEIGKFERNAKKLRSAAVRAEQHLSELLAQAEVSVPALTS